jgi:putative ribosome biogenesis GTPase RsgA
VRDAVEAGGISEVRYVSYLNMLESLRAGRFDVGR